MKINYIELVGFKRFMLNEIERFSMKIVNPLLVILGTNGSGKSSLLEQLTPYPPLQSDFLKTGSKELHITHRNSEYVLKSIFSPGQKHFFSKDGKVLNDWGTSGVQRELVREHFSIDAKTHALTLGSDRFHAMALPKRKEWFVELCDTDYDYAISVFNKLREKHRDIQGALKVAKKRVSVEIEKLLNTEEEKQIKQHANALHEFLQYLMEHRKPVESDIDLLGMQQSEMSQTLKKNTDRLSQLTRNLGDSSLYSNQSLQTIIAGLSERISAYQALLEKTGDQSSAINEKITVLQKAEQQTIESLQADISVVIGQIAKIDTKLMFTQDDFDAHSAIETFEAIRGTLVDIFVNIPNNKNQLYSSVQLSSARKEHNEQKLKEEYFSKECYDLQARIKHMNDHKSKPNASCPKCHHAFSLNFDELLLQDYIKKQDAHQEKLNKEIRPKIVELAEYIEKCQEYALYYRQFHTLTLNASLLNSYWSMLADRSIITQTPEQGITILDQISHDLALQLQKSELLKTKKEKMALLHSLRNVGAGDLTTLIAQRDKMSKEIEAYTSKLMMLGARKDRYQSTLASSRQIEQIKQQVGQLVGKKDQLLNEQIETIRRTVFNDLIRQVQSLLATKEHILNQAKLQQGVVDNVQKQIVEMTQDEQAYAVLVKALSPTEGLIAEGLFGFIRAFVNRMNGIIKKTWAYPMVIEPCMLSGETVDLDYKFPVKINNEEIPTPDVSKTSKGQKDIIDLAFLITSMSYLGMTDSYLILDEMGSAFDAEHKNTLILLIKALVEQQTFQQVFLVSHDYHQYSALNAQVVVLCSANVVTPHNYNHHVEMA